MKKIFLSLFLTAVTCSIYAQVVIPDNIIITQPSRSDDKAPAAAAAPAVTASSELAVENNVRSNIYVFEQNYQLTDNNAKKGNRIGRAGSNYFGTVYSYGVKAGNSCYSDLRFSSPWLYDANFEPYSNNAQYTPVKADKGTKYRLMSATQFAVLSYTEVGGATQGIITITSKQISGAALGVDAANGTQNGWTVWVLGDNKLVTQPTTLTFTNGKSSSVKAPDGAVFGAFIIGEVGRLLLSGIALQTDDKWIFGKPASTGSAVPATAAATPASSSSPAVEAASDELTPVQSTNSIRGKHARQ